ncbi:MAG: peptide chain release factor 2 [Patescibacteria group bacterium]|nr:peptide chain release factor 2 [Patescibacteria group bacterium]
MDDIKLGIKKLQSDLGEILPSINLDTKNKQLQELTNKQASPDFWSDRAGAQLVNQQISKLTAITKPWNKIILKTQELKELADLNDNTLANDLSKQLADLQQEFLILKKQAMFNGPYDDHDVIMTIFAGAGGTDAQDWAGMLERMYLRWAEQEPDTSAKILDESAGEEAGIKSTTIEISGSLVYGKLRGEHGVHRLVRLSPFNADNLRQTSFAKVDVLPKIDAPEEVVIDEKDLKIDVYRAGGHGGQSVNTTDSAVRITHLPTGIAVAIQNERSQLQNKETAMTILRSKLAQLQLEQHATTIQDLKGPNEQAAWGNQIRNYVLHPYNMVKDTRTKAETSDVKGVLNGDLSKFI